MRFQKTRAAAALAFAIAIGMSGKARANSIADWLTMKVCVSASGSILPTDPLHCPAAQLRPLRPGQALPYYAGDYPPVGETNSCNNLGTNRRYSFTMPFQVRDQTGAAYPLYAAWDNYPAGHCTWSTPTIVDTVTFMTVQGGLTTNMGGANEGMYTLVTGTGYANLATSGIGRFNRTWGFPAIVPPTGVTSGTVLLKNTVFLPAGQIAGFPAHGSASGLFTTAEWWRRLWYVYGPTASPTRPVDTLLLVGFAQANATNDGPGPSTGSEHLYISKEIGYVTRWEDWHRDDNLGGDPNAGGTLANVAYSNADCGQPASLTGQISPHFVAQPVTTDTVHGYYSQVLSVTQPDGSVQTHSWYMVGCHDYTNLHPLPQPLDPTTIINANGLAAIGGGTPDQANQLIQQFAPTTQLPR